ncbi:MAG: hypothetical protein GY779_16610, partial [Gammaproteobacteria bacterium]|nr:hypothetical protein [Gammaproteobacteria bacterium]
LTNIVAIAAGYLHALALDDQGRVWQWGNYTSFFTGRDESEPSLVHVWGGETIDNITQIAAGHGHSLALTNTGEIWEWDTTGYPLKVRDVIGLYPVSKILAGGNFSVAVAEGRGYSTVMTWGATDYSQLGRDPDKFSSEVTRGWDPIPGKVDISDIGDIAVGDHFVIVRKNDGTVWTWGDNRYGQLTAGLPGAESIAPIRIEKLDGTIGISAGGNTAMAIPASSACDVGGRTGFRLLAWGDNFEGTRGDGTGVNWFAPTPVLTIGDSEVCSGLNGYRLIIYKKGIGKGTVESSAPGLTCTGMMCWQSVDVNTEITLTATPDTDSEFAEWRWDCSTGTVFVDTNPEISLFMDGVKHCKVHFDQIEERTLEVNVSGQGSVSSSPSGIDCGGDCSHSFAIDTEVTLTAEANAGNEFVAWSGDDTCYDNIDPTDAKRATINMNENINCTATFVEEGGEESGAGPIITINVFGDSANSNVTVSDIAGVQSSFECDTTTGICGKTYDPDTTLSLDTTLESGYTFSWSGGSACGVLANTNSTSFNLTLLEDMNVVCRLDFEPIEPTNSLY